MFYVKYRKQVLWLVALGISILLWHYVYYDVNRSEYSIIYNIEFRNKPKGLYTEYNYDNKKVLVKVKGKKSRVSDFVMYKSNITCYVDLKDAVSGERLYKILLESSKDTKELLDEVELILNKEGVRINYYEYVRKKVKVSGRVLGYEGQVTKGYKISYNPSHIELLGPSSILENIDKVEVKDYKVSRMYNYFDIKDKVKLKVLPKGVEVVSKVRNGLVGIYIDIESKLKYKVLEKINIIVMENVFSGVRVKGGALKLSYIRYKGPEGLISGLRKDKVRVYINLLKYKKPGKYRVKVSPEEIEGIRIVNYKPKYVTIVLEAR